MHLVRRYNKISPWVEQSLPRLLNGVGKAASPPQICPLGGASASVLRTRRSATISKIFLFISHFPSVEDGPGGIYLSGLSPNPANRRYLRIDPSARVG